MSNFSTRLLPGLSEDSTLFPFFNNFFNDLPLSLLDSAPNYPKYNIFTLNKNANDQFFVQLSVAGFSKEEIKVSKEGGDLVVKAEHQNKMNVDEYYVCKGITDKDFVWKLKLPKLAEIKKVHLINGILTIYVVMPNEKGDKPKYFDIETK